MAGKTSPRQLVAAFLTGVFLLGFVILFSWMLYLTWTARGQLPRFAQTPTFTHVTTSMVGLIGGVAATRMGQRSSSGSQLQSTFGWIYVIVYFILGFAALTTLLVQTASGNRTLVPEAVNNLGTVSFGLALGAVGAFLGVDT